jgi:hypothetical protein
LDQQEDLVRQDHKDHVVHLEIQVQKGDQEIKVVLAKMEIQAQKDRLV